MNNLNVLKLGFFCHVMDISIIIIIIIIISIMCVTIICTKWVISVLK